jgi:hypothetical protein
MHENSPAQFKIENIEILIGQDKKVSATYILRVDDEQTMEKGPNEIFKSKQALIKAL